MCNVCGCGEGEVQIDGRAPHDHDHGPHGHHHGHDHDAGHAHDHGHGHGHAGEDDHAHKHSHEPGHAPHGHDHLDYGLGPARAHAPGLSQGRMVQIEQGVLAKNDQYASANRQWLADRGTLALNLVSSPGSGKTTLLTRTVEELSGHYPVVVIEGDQQTQNDADRLRATGVPTVQINTGKGCHLDGHMVGHALERLAPPEYGMVFIENVGNLVCPSGFDLGEDAKVVVLSTTEGEDKPIKYPDMFHRADLMLLNKADLLPHLAFDKDQCLAYARQINPAIEVIEISATGGQGLDQWYAWLAQRRRARLQALAEDLEGRASAARAAMTAD